VSLLVSFALAAIAAQALLPWVATWRRIGSGPQAVLYVALTIGFATLAGWLASLRPRWRPEVPTKVSLQRFGWIAAWVAGATALSRLGPWWSVGGGGLAAVILSKSLRDMRLPDARAEIGVGFGFAAALAAQTAAVALGMDRMFWAVTLAGTGCFLVAWRAGWHEGRQTRAELVAGLLAILLMANFAFLRGKGGIAEPSVAQAAPAQAPPKSTLRGVILLTIPKKSSLKLPPSLLSKEASAQRLKAQTTSIPFSGEYWIFPSLWNVWGGKRTPVLRRPPPLSPVERGDPVSMSFTAINKWMPLVMKAYQVLDQPIPLAGWQRIDVAGESADSLAGVVSVELVLTDSEFRYMGSVSLGEEVVPTGSAQFTVQFTVPRESRIKKFDVIEVVFHLGEPRRDKSAKMSVKRFDLVR
jgi:hypothetical protein